MPRGGSPSEVAWKSPTCVCYAAQSANIKADDKPLQTNGELSSGRENKRANARRHTGETSQRTEPAGDKQSEQPRELETKRRRQNSKQKPTPLPSPHNASSRSAKNSRWKQRTNTFLSKTNIMNPCLKGDRGKCGQVGASRKLAAAMWVQRFRTHDNDKHFIGILLKHFGLSHAFVHAKGS
jgi:hypothetical protein